MVVDNHTAFLFLLHHYIHISPSHRMPYRHKRTDFMFDKLLNGRAESAEEDRSLTNKNFL